MVTSLVERFEKKVEKTPTCWVWKGFFGKKRYGQYQFRSQGRKRIVLAHRHSYRLYVGEIPYGMTLDHTCQNPQCVNPAHLEPVPEWVNQIRGMVNMRLKTKGYVTSLDLSRLEMQTAKNFGVKFS